MGKLTLLQLKEGIEYPPELLAKVKQSLGATDTAYYNEETSLLKSYQSRFAILHKAFHFIADSLPPVKDMNTVREYPALCQKQIPLPEYGTLKEYQELLVCYTSRLIDGLTNFLNWSSLSESSLPKRKQVIQFLNKAEQYVIMLEGRPDLATLIPYKDEVEGKSYYILQRDRQLPSCTQDTLEEFTRLKKGGTLITPTWFRNLTPFQQMFFYINSSETIKSLHKQLNRFEKSWLHLNRISPIVPEELEAILTNTGPLPKWFLSMPVTDRQLLMMSLASKDKKLQEQFVDLKDLLKEKDLEKKLNQIAGRPFWYLIMSKDDQCLFNTAIPRVDNLADNILFFSSRQRELPVLPNFASHDLSLWDECGNTIKAYPSRYRSSHLATRCFDKIDPGLADYLKRLHSIRNLKLIRTYAGDETEAILLQTLISPNYLFSWFIPDAGMNMQRLMAVSSLQQDDEKDQIIFINTNHPLNLARILTPTTTNDPECNKLLQIARINLMSDAIKKQASQLPRSEFAPLWEDLIINNIKFISEQGHEAYGELLGLLETCRAKMPKEQTNWSFATTKSQIALAIQEAKGLRHSLSTGRASLKKVSKANPVLVDLFVKNLPRIKNLGNWQDLFSNQLFLKHIHAEPAWIDFSNRITDLHLLHKEYQDLLNSEFGTGHYKDFNGRELFLSSLEQLLAITHKNVFPYGSCVSGKDRKAIELIHTDAMLLYRYLYNDWPSYKDAPDSLARKRFVNLVAEIYCSRHAHTHAGQNAPGADGIKNAATYWPADIAAAINKRLGSNTLNEDDRKATNNEVEHIGKLSPTARNYATCLVAAKTLNVRNCQQLIAIITVIVQEKEYWKSKKAVNFFGTMPNGIKKIKLFLEKNKNSSPIEIVAQIYSIVFSRLEDGAESVRNEATEEFYNLLKKLCLSKKPERDFKSIFKNLETIKSNAFNANPAITV